MVTRSEIFDTGLPLQATALIAEKLSVGRTKLVSTPIGIGSVLQAVGMTGGNALLDVIFNDPHFRYVKPMLENSVLDVSLPLVRSSIDELSQAGISGFGQPEADALKKLAEVPDVVTQQEVIEALERG
jgi:hypothetical protein